MPLAARTSDRLIAISQATAADVRRYRRVPDSKLDVVHSGGGATPAETPEPEAVLRERHHLGKRQVVLSVIWIDRGFSALSEERLAATAAALIIIGLQVFFSSFLLSILGLRRRDPTQLDRAHDERLD